MSFIPIIRIAIYPAISNLIKYSKSLKNISEVNLKAITPMSTPITINIYWSLMATAVVILSIENAKSVIDNNATTLKKSRFLFVIDKSSDREVSIFLFLKITFEKNKYIKYKPANILIKRNFNKKPDNKISNILNISEIVMPIFRALVLSVEFFKYLVKDAKAIALSADSNISKLIKIGSNVKISDQLSIWSRVGIKEFTDAVSINYFHSQSKSNIM